MTTPAASPAGAGRYVLFRDDTRGECKVFASPSEIIVAEDADAFFPALARLDEVHRAGKWLAGFFSYEAGYLFEKKLAPLAAENLDIADDLDAGGLRSSHRPVRFGMRQRHAGRKHER